MVDKTYIMKDLTVEELELLKEGIITVILEEAAEGDSEKENLLDGLFGKLSEEIKRRG